MTRSPASGLRRLRLGSIRVTALSIVIVVLLAGGPALMLYAIASVKDERQVTFLEMGAIALTIAFGLWALASLRAMWRAAGAARSGRAMGFAILGGLAGIGAIGSLAVTFVLALLWGS